MVIQSYNYRPYSINICVFFSGICPVTLISHYTNIFKIIGPGDLDMPLQIHEETNVYIFQLQYQFQLKNLYISIITKFNSITGIARYHLRFPFIRSQYLLNGFWLVSSVQIQVKTTSRIINSRSCYTSVNDCNIRYSFILIIETVKVNIDSKEISILPHPTNPQAETVKWVIFRGVIFAIFVISWWNTNSNPREILLNYFKHTVNIDSRYIYKLVWLRIQGPVNMCNFVIREIVTPWK